MNLEFLFFPLYVIGKNKLNVYGKRNILITINKDITIIIFIVRGQKATSLKKEKYDHRRYPRNMNIITSFDMNTPNTTLVKKRIGMVMNKIVEVK